MRKQKIILIFLLFSSISFYSYSQHCDSVLWTGYNSLQWKHFKGYPDRNSTASALSDASIIYHFSIVANLLKFKFSSSFSTCGSWIKSTASYRLLEHEQGHFDLVEYHKRLMVKELMNQKFTSKGIEQNILSIAERINALRVEADTLYDIETNYSRNQEKQKEWLRKIRKMIEALDEYGKSSYLVKIN